MRQAMLYKSINTPWVLVRRADGEELWRGDDEPTREASRVPRFLSRLSSNLLLHI